YAPGPWTPDRLGAAGVTCACRACQQPWPSAHAWWHAHTAALAITPPVCRDHQIAPLANRDAPGVDAGISERPSPPRAVEPGDTVPPPGDRSTSASRVPKAVTDALLAPGPWTPDRLRAAGTTCPCQACQQPWPDADAWWRAHNLLWGEEP